MNKIFNRSFYDFKYYEANGLKTDHPYSASEMFNSLADGYRDGVDCDAACLGTVAVFEALLGSDNVHYLFSQAEEQHGAGLLTKDEHVVALIGNIALDHTPLFPRIQRVIPVVKASQIKLEQKASLNSHLLFLGRALKESLLGGASAFNNTTGEALTNQFDSLLSKLFGNHLEKEVIRTLYSERETIEEGASISRELQTLAEIEQLEGLDEVALNEPEKFLSKNLENLLAFGNLNKPDVIKLLEQLANLDSTDLPDQEPYPTLPTHDDEALKKIYLAAVAKITEADDTLTAEELLQEYKTASDAAVFLMANAVLHDGAVSLETRARLVELSGYISDNLPRKAQKKQSEDAGEDEEKKFELDYGKILSSAQELIQQGLSAHYAVNEDFDELVNYVLHIRENYGTFHAKQRKEINTLRHGFSAMQKKELRHIALYSKNAAVGEVIRRLLL